MKLVNFACPGCGAQLEVDVDLKQATCPYCNKTFPVDDEVQRFEMQGAAQAGYEFEKGRQQAQAEFAAQQQPQQVYVNVQPAQPPKKRKTWLWVLGWIFIFPIPLTLIMLNNETVKQKLKPPVRYGIIVAGWLLYLAIGFGYGGSGSNQSGKTNTGSSSAAVTAVQSSSASASASANAIELVAGQQGQYGREVTMSEGTDMEEKFFAYYVPAGTYDVKNLDSRPTQVSVYEGFKKGDNGYDEYTATGDIVVIKAGETGTVNVPDGWFIEIHEPAHIALTAK